MTALGSVVVPTVNPSLVGVIWPPSRASASRVNRSASVGPPERAADLVQDGADLFGT